MTIDTKKFIELLSEATGQDIDKIEKQLADLLTEINEALEQGDAYEVEGFGIFTRFGQNITFLPSTELETEINYKYAGMQPIELDEEIDSQESGEEGDVQDEAAESMESSNPFAGLIDDEDLEELDRQESESFQGFQESEDDELDLELSEQLEDVFEATDEATASDEESQEIEDYQDTEDAEDEIIAGDDGDDIDDLIGATDDLMESVSAEPEPGSEESELSTSLDEDLDESDADTEEKPDAPKQQPGPDKWGIDTYKDSDENAFAALLGDKKDEERAQNIGAGAQDDDDDDETSLNDLLNAEMDDDGDGLDPFEEAGADSGKKTSDAGKDDEDIIPVIRDVGSGVTTPEEDLASLDDIVEEEQPKVKPEKNKEKASPILLLLIIIISFGGIGYVAVTYGFIDLDRLLGREKEPQVVMLPPPPPNNQLQQPPQNDLVDNSDNTSPNQIGQTQEAVNNEGAQSPTEVGNTAQEQQPDQNMAAVQDVTEQTEDVMVQVSDGPSDPVDESDLGMYGRASTNMSGVYTVVVYSLTNEQAARNKVAELEEAGLKVRLTQMSSQRFGTLWRISLGHFRELRDAAIAMDELGAPYTDDYFIIEI